MLNRSASLAMSTSILKALPCRLDIKRHSPSILYLAHLSVFHLPAISARFSYKFSFGTVNFPFCESQDLITFEPVDEISNKVVF